ncbi:MAG: hypothetical protein Q7T55_17705, partial [Solirubrobacteraceae bacterium]|nr:hypothetical protein [Solirubrobacteraceae bacterium]
MKTFHSRALCRTLIAALIGAASLPALADVITDWNERSAVLIGEARIGTPPAVRVMALVQTAAYAAVRDAGTAPQAIDAAVAAAHRSALTQLLPAQKAAIDASFQSAVAQLPDDAARAQHLAVGERAAQRVLAERAGEMPRTPDNYRP